MQRYEDAGHINVGPGEDLAISELAEMIRQVVHPAATIVYDRLKAHGMWGAVWRTAHGDEVDLLMETAPETFAMIECKTSERVTVNDLKGVRQLADEYGEGSIVSARVVCRTPTRYPVGGGAMAVPLSEAEGPAPPDR